MFCGISGSSVAPWRPTVTSLPHTGKIEARPYNLVPFWDRELIVAVILNCVIPFKDKNTEVRNKEKNQFLVP